MKRIAGKGFLINHNEKVNFSFDGRNFSGFRGDSLAAAMLANGVKLFGRSFKYHRPRGIMASSVDEMNALVEIGTGEYRDPNNRMSSVELRNGLVAHSQNRYPSLECDFGAINNILSKIFVSGFYYKTFKYPRKFWEPLYEKIIRKMAGLGTASKLPDPDNYSVHHAHYDVVVVGAGLAGLKSAEIYARAGLKTLLLEQHAYIGGYAHNCGANINGQPADQFCGALLTKLAEYKNLTIKLRTTCVANYDFNFITALERVTDHLDNPPAHLPRMRFWKIRTKTLIHATGSLERPLVFADNDRPGVMLAGAVRDYFQQYGVVVGRHIAIFTNNDSAYTTASLLAGHAKLTIIDLRDNPPIMAEYKDKFTIYSGYSITKVHGCGNFKDGLKGVTICKLVNGAISDLPSVDSLDIQCDIVAHSAGFVPTIHLWSQGRGSVDYSDDLHAFVPRDIPYNQRAVGGLMGCDDFSSAIIQAEQTAKNVIGQAIESDAWAVQSDEHSIKGANIMHAPALKPSGMERAKHFVDFQNDVTSADIALAQREGYVSIEHTKRYTTTGMATDQGKTSNLNALDLVARIQGKPLPAVGFTTFRPPFTTTNMGAIAGQAVGKLFMQERHTTIHNAHEQCRAPYENVGDWKRPWYFPLNGEDIHAATMRESLAVRKSVGMVDASTLGKIDIQGKDALKLLNHVYTNDFSKLAINQCKYGLMLNENGMVFDDGVTTRLGENHYHLTTTTGGAGRVMNWLEEWLQTEYPSWEVYCTSVTEQWAVASIAGPRARDTLAKLVKTDISGETFPFMTMRNVDVAGIPARVYRISFTGELSFEINVPARYGLALWNALRGAGEEYNLTLYGTESMHILRAEKGYIIVGQDTDGTITPNDLGMGKMVSKNKDCAGKRSLTRADMQRPDRRQLVGLMTTDPNIVLTEGAHVIAHNAPTPKFGVVTPHLGNVTSSYFSPILGRSIALALIKGGRGMMGQKLTVPRMNGAPVEVTICDTVFYDKEGAKLHG